MMKVIWEKMYQTAHKERKKEGKEQRKAKTTQLRAMERFLGKPDHMRVVIRVRITGGFFLYAPFDANKNCWANANPSKIKMHLT